MMIGPNDCLHISWESYNAILALTGIKNSADEMGLNHAYLLEKLRRAKSSIEYIEDILEDYLEKERR